MEEPASKVMATQPRVCAPNVLLVRVVSTATQIIVTIVEHVRLVLETPACVLLVLLALSVRLMKITAQIPHVKMEEPVSKVMATQPHVCVQLVTADCRVIW